MSEMRKEIADTLAQLQGHEHDEVDHASLIPMLVFEAGIAVPIGKFYVSKAQLEEGLKFIAEGRDAEQRQARRRHIFSTLIAASHK